MASIKDLQDQMNKNSQAWHGANMGRSAGPTWSRWWIVDRWKHIKILLPG